MGRERPQTRKGTRRRSITEGKYTGKKTGLKVSSVGLGDGSDTKYPLHSIRTLAHVKARHGYAQLQAQHWDRECKNIRIPGVY